MRRGEDDDGGDDRADQPARFVQKLSIREIARRFRMSRKTVRKAIEAAEGSFAYEREVQPMPKLGAHVEALEALLAAKRAEAAARAADAGAAL